MKLRLLFLTLSASAASIISAAQDSYQHMTLPPVNMDERFHEELNQISALLINRRHPNLSKGDCFSAGNVMLICESNDAIKPSQQKFILTVNHQQIALNTEHGQEKYLLTQYYDEGDTSYFGPFLRIQKLENVPIPYIEPVCKILKRLFLHKHLKIEVVPSDVLLMESLFKSDFVKIDTLTRTEDAIVMMTPIYVNKYVENMDIFRGTIQTSMFQENPKKRLYEKIAEHVDNVLLNKESLQVYQWAMLTKIIFIRLEECLLKHKKESAKNLSTRSLQEYEIYETLHNIFAIKTIEILSMQGFNMELEEGSTIFMNIPSCPQNEEKFPPLQLSCYAKGGWIGGKRTSSKPFLAPDFFIDIRNRIPEGQFAYRKFPICKKEMHFVISNRGIEEGNFLIVKNEGASSVVYFLDGMKSEHPFSQRPICPFEKSLATEEFILPLPSDENDLDILSYLLSQIDQEEQEQIIQKSIDDINAVEDLPGDDLNDDEKDKFLTRAEEIKQEKIKKIEKEKKEREDELKKREAIIKAEEIKKIEEILLKKERYNQQVKREQEARSRQVVKETDKQHHKKRGGKPSPQSPSAQQFAPQTPVETDEQMQARIHLEADAIFNQRCIKLRDLAQRINAIFKINSQARSILFRQSGSHMVANGATEAAGPCTFVIPHGGDGTITRKSAENFLLKFVKLIIKNE
ncbi:MAG: hypothetical protein CNLJKLNK_00336 [Holosporales bacterium]